MSVTAFFVILTGAHRHGHRGWTSREIAAATFGLIAAAAAVAVALVALRWWMRKRASERKPCPGCGTFLAPGEECPVCPPDAGAR